MDRDLALIVLIACSRSIHELASLPPMLKEFDAGDKEAIALRKAIGRAIAEIMTNILDPVEAQHPDLRAEAEARYTKYGCRY